MEAIENIRSLCLMDLYSLYRSAHLLLDNEHYSQWYENHELFWLHYLPKSNDAVDNLLLIREVKSKKIGVLKIDFNFHEEKNKLKKIYQERLERQKLLISQDSPNTFNRLVPQITDHLLEEHDLTFIKQLDIKLILPVIYDDVNIIWDKFHRDQFLIVKKDSKFGLMDNSTNVLIPTEFHRIALIHPCFLLCFQNQRCGLYNLKDGRMSIPVEYNSITPINPHNLFICEKSDRVGVIDWNNQIVIPFIYDSISPITNGLIIVRNNKRGFVEFSGQEILPPNYFLIEYLDNKHLIIKKENDDLKRFIYNLEEQSFLEIPDYDILKGFHYDLMRVKKGDKQALIRVDGTILVDFTEDYMKILHTYWAIIDEERQNPNN